MKTRMDIDHANRTCKRNPTDTEFLLSAIRAATLRARLAATEFDSIGIALRRGLVSPDEAVAWLSDLNLLDHVLCRPEKINESNAA
jgi:hypothetical protein